MLRTGQPSQPVPGILFGWLRRAHLLAGDAAQAIPAGAPTVTVVFSGANGVEEALALHATTPDGVSDEVPAGGGLEEKSTDKEDSNQ